MPRRRIQLTTRTPAPLAVDLFTPETGSGPGLVLCPAMEHGTEAVQRAAELFAQEGYVVAVPLSDDANPLRPQDVVACLDALAAAEQCKGAIAAVSYGSGAGAALRCAAQGLLECVACYQPQGLDALLPELKEVGVPLLLHLQAQLAANSAFADAVRASQKGEVYVYSDGAAGGLVPGGPGAPPSAGIAHSRTLALLRATVGPRYDLSALWDEHRNCEFVSRDADATMRTMVAQPYVNHVPTLIGGYGASDLHHFYSRHFIPNNPADMRSIPVSRTVGADRVVNETILCFTHDREIEWMLPGIAPTGRYVEVALIGIITFRGGKLAHEHIYWDQASVLVQIGLLDPAGLPVAGAEAARKVLDPSLPSNALLRNWTPP
jgi:carboxymethylenebutenolidase